MENIKTTFNIYKRQMLKLFEATIVLSCKMIFQTTQKAKQ